MDWHAAIVVLRVLIMRLLATIDECGALLEPSARRSEHRPRRVGVLGCVAAPHGSYNALSNCLEQIKEKYALGKNTELKSSAANADVTSVVCRAIAGMADVVGIAAWTFADVVYDASWLKPNVRHIWCDRDGLVKPFRAFLVCYQEILQRLALHANEVGADDVEVLIDHHQCFDEKYRRKPGWQILREAHDWLVNRGESWGVKLAPLVAPHPVSVPSEKDPRLTAVDFFAGAVHKWICDEPAGPRRALVDIVRSYEGKVARYGIIAVPKPLKDRFTEQQCQQLLRQARQA